MYYHGKQLCNFLEISNLLSKRIMKFTRLLVMCQLSFIICSFAWCKMVHNVWSIKNRTIFKMSLWLYYDFLANSHFILQISHAKILPKNIHKVTKTDYVILSICGSFDIWLTYIINWQLQLTKKLKRPLFQMASLSNRILN